MFSSSTFCSEAAIVCVSVRQVMSKVVISTSCLLNLRLFNTAVHLRRCLRRSLIRHRRYISIPRAVHCRAWFRRRDWRVFLLLLYLFRSLRWSYNGRRRSRPGIFIRRDGFYRLFMLACSEWMRWRQRFAGVRCASDRRAVLDGRKLWSSRLL